MAGFENDVVVAKNLNFDLAAAKPHLGIINAAGKLPIGTGNVQPSPEILGGSLTSPNNSITFGYSSPNITAVVNTSVVQDLHTARFIVSAGGLTNGANYTTIASAIAAAAGTGVNQTVFIQPGTYTENLTLVPGINLAAYNGDQDTPNVTIVGTCTLTTAGTVSISDIRLQTNSSFLLAVTGSAASIVNLNNCFLNCTNNTGITYTSSSGSSRINVMDCKGNLGTTGIALFASSSAGAISFLYCRFLNSGGSSTASTISAGSLASIWSNFGFPITTSGTSASNSFQTIFDTAAQNVACYTVGGSGTNGIVYSQFYSGTASALSVGATAVVNSSFFSSSNTNCITGAGTLNYSNLTFISGSSVKINTTTQSGGVASGGVAQAPSAGFIGEQISSVTSGAVTSTVISNITSISVTAGVWDISCAAQVLPSVSITSMNLAISANSASFTGTGSGDSLLQYGTAASSVLGLSIPSFRVVLTSTTTYYLVQQSTFSGTATAAGRISATRVG